MNEHLDAVLCLALVLCFSLHRSSDSDRSGMFCCNSYCSGHRWILRLQEEASAQTHKSVLIS